MKFERTLNPKDEDILDIRNILRQYNAKKFEILESEDFAIYAKDETGKIIGGITGEIFGQWMDIEYLAVDEAYRNQKIGHQLLQEAEQLAHEHKCGYIFIYTFGFQAKDYYPKYGYEEVFRRAHYPITGTEHYFVKTL
ncbi:GNAT family N-acetyltransferase [Vagococcus silagei]|uniref:N-acetyltransferase n=1 Tax=Vagococcus silagei TaxID=2508885 RepID=A0A4S3B7E4_9ENTE|nr:GNAT family N-acetyltransferase [Vagococcus silagei]THB61566.1 N-acetyltransferase [Vagococcus silagei]